MCVRDVNHDLPSVPCMVCFSMSLTHECQVHVSRFENKIYRGFKIIFSLVRNDALTYFLVKVLYWF